MVGVRKILGNKGEPGGPKKDVLVVTAPIMVEEIVPEAKVAVKSVPAEMVPAGALTDYKIARGRWAKYPLMVGDILVDTKLAPKGTPTGLMGKLHPGMRAITLRVDEQTGISGFILPEYRVDILKAHPGENKESRARLLLKNVRVLAAGQVIDNPEGRTIESETVTVEVTPSQAELLAAAMKDGPLSLTLRPLGNPDESTMPEEPKPEELPPAPEPVVVAAPPPPEPFPVLTRAPQPPPRRLTVFAGRHQLQRVHGHQAPPAQEAEVPPGVRSPFQMDQPTGLGYLPGPP
jgi:pilus assembly protein CpaB